MNSHNRIARKTLISGMVAATLIALLVGWSIFNVVSDFKNAAYLKARNHEVTSALSKLQIGLVNAEKNQRGFVIGADEEAESTYLDAVQEIRWSTDLIFALASKDATQRAMAQRLEGLIANKLRTLQFIIDVRKTGSMQTAQLLMSIEQDKLETDLIKNVLDEMESRENILLDQALASRDAGYRQLWWTLGIVVFFVFALAIWQYMRVRHIVQHAESSAAKIRHMAEHDALTGLPNRRLLQHRLDTHIAQAGSDRQMLAVMFMDLDGFKKVNDTIGHQAGDELLRSVAQRLRTTIRSSDTVARLGGDEFVVVLPELNDTATAAQVAKSLVDVISKPYRIQDAYVNVSASIGISFYPRDAKSSTALLAIADQALNQAKGDGKNQFKFAFRESNFVSVR